MSFMGAIILFGTGIITIWASTYRPEIIPNFVGIETGMILIWGCAELADGLTICPRRKK